jgi:hypothetical protein
MYGLGEGFDLSVTGKICYMLCGMALELAYKATLVEEGKEPPMKHDLVELARLADIKMNEDDELTLKIWSHLIVWDGKYPVPKNKPQMEEFGNLVEETLWDQVDGTPFKRRNNRLKWDDFNKFWAQARERYFSVCARNP